MTEDEGPPSDGDSSLFRLGQSAFTFAEMGAFVREIEARPPEKFLSDLPSLLSLPEAKYNLVVVALRKRLRRVGEDQRTAILERLNALAAEAADLDVRGRCEELLARLG